MPPPWATAWTGASRVVPADPGPEGPPLTEGVRAALLARRVVMVSGQLDQPQASEVAATLMTLDAIGDDHVELHITSATGPIEPGMVLIDVMEVLGVPVHTVGMGVVGGVVVGVLAAGTHRQLSRHARLNLREPDVEVSGRATEIERALAEHAARRETYYRLLARCTGRPVSEIEAEWVVGHFTAAEDAIALGYADKLLP